MCPDHCLLFVMKARRGIRGLNATASRRREFPDAKWFSPRNLKYIGAFARAYPDGACVQQADAHIHGVLHPRDPGERFRVGAICMWSEAQIKIVFWRMPGRSLISQESRI